MTGKNGWVAIGASVVAVTAVAATVAVATKSGDSGNVGGGDDGSAKALTALTKLSPVDVLKSSTHTVSSKGSAKIKMTMTLPSMTETAEGSVKFGDTIAAQMTVNMTGTTAQTAQVGKQLGAMEMRMDSEALYAKFSGTAASALGGKEWVKMTYADFAKVPGLSGFSFMKDMAKNNDPSQKMQALLASPDLKSLGVEQHNGVSAIHYNGDVSTEDMLKATAAGTGMTQADLDTLRANLTKAGVTSTHYELWVDGAGLPVEIKFDEQTKLGTVSGDLTYSDWGAPVTVAIPPADQTVDFVSLLAAKA
jgi:hypothetical protein